MTDRTTLKAGQGERNGNPAPTRDGVVLSARNITKSFGGVTVLDDVGLTLRAGEVHAVLGENGAGKSTLTKIIAGVHQPDAGTIELDGKAIVVGSPLQARQLGIALIHQEPLAFPDLDVAENIFVGRMPYHRGVRLLDWRSTYAAARRELDSLGVDLDPRRKMRELSTAQQQMVDVANALSEAARVVIMDEPTASLTPAEVEDLFRIVRQLRERGVALVFVSHRLEEVFAIADRITVLRDGRLVDTRPAAEATIEGVIHHMVGRSLGALYEKEPAAAGAPLLEVSGLSLPGVFSDISLDVRAGEIVGLAGLVGSGRTDVAQAIFGITPAERGTVTIAGAPTRIASPRDAIARGLAFVPEDRGRHGLLLPMSIVHNGALTVLSTLARSGWLEPGQERSVVGATLDRLRLRGATGLDQPVGQLSGGNQQKVVLAKWLLTRPRILILDEPTRGIDVGAKAEVHRLMGELASQGMAILMISSELPEILAMSDRVVVMREGRITGRFERAEATQERIMATATASVEAAS
ncbi:MAG: sugar ABC transporter ATP-binding protein [Thermomicrobiales bacterium]|nr:sugar ABC transporter ATP-binding protein [Thermomicrobiales bacterium]